MIFGGYGRKAKQRGEVFFVCFECQRLNVFGLLENYGYAQLYGVRVAKYGSERFMACSHCQRGWDLDADQWHHALKVSKVLGLQADLSSRQLSQSALVLAEGAFPDLVPAVREVVADELAGGLDTIFQTLPEVADDRDLAASTLSLMSGGNMPLPAEPPPSKAVGPPIDALGLISGATPPNGGSPPPPPPPQASGAPAPPPTERKEAAHIDGRRSARPDGRGGRSEEEGAPVPGGRSLRGPRLGCATPERRHHPGRRAGAPSGACV